MLFNFKDTLWFVPLLIFAGYSTLTNLPSPFVCYVPDHFLNNSYLSFLSAFTLLPVDSFSYPVMSTLVILLCQFAGFASYRINCCIWVTI